MWTAGFPEPKTFSKRVARLMKDRRGDFDIVHDNQTLGYGMLDIAEQGFPLIATIHHPITFDRRIDIANAPTLRKKLSLRRWYGFLRMQKKVARQLPKILTVSESSRRDIVTDFGVDPSRLEVITLGVDDVFVPPTAPRVPGRIVAMASADAPMKGIATLLEAFAKLRTERDVELVLVTKPGQRTDAAHRRAGHRRRRAVRQRHQRVRARRRDGLGRGRLRAVAVRRLLPPDRRADGLRHPVGRQPGRRDPRGRRRRRRLRDAGDPRRRRRARGRDRSSCWTTRSAARRWAAPAGSGCWRRSAGARWRRPPQPRTKR